MEGWDYNNKSIDNALKVLDHAVCVDLNDLRRVEEISQGRRFDLIICADVLEHIVDPWSLIRILSNCLAEKGEIIVSLPNFGFWETHYNLLRRKLPRNERGIYDKTHIRNFCLRNLGEFSVNKLNLEIVSRNFRIFDDPKGRLAHRFGQVTVPIFKRLPYFKDMITFQFIFKLVKK